MKGEGLTGFFETFLSKKSLFKNKKALQSGYTPETIPHREKQIKQIANILAPILRLERPSNLFIYGKTGTGKTLSVKYVANALSRIISEKELPIKLIYVNCKLKRTADTEYRLMAQLTRELGREMPPTGLPTEEVYRAFFDIIDKKEQVIILLLDEIDELAKKTGDGILYNITRINDELKNAQLSLVGISNDLVFADNLDPRVKSSLSEEELVFPPYNALQIQNILRTRASAAIKSDAISDGVIEKCAAYAARDHGDARRALELLRVSGEVAERNTEQRIALADVDLAEEKIERDRLVDIVSTQPKQIQAALYAILSISVKNDVFFTGDVYNAYLDVCKRTSLRPLTQRRISDIITELDMFGIITAKVISKGRYGKTREIGLSLPKQTVPKIQTTLVDALGF